MPYHLRTAILFFIGWNGKFDHNGVYFRAVYPLERVLRTTCWAGCISMVRSKAYLGFWPRVLRPLSSLCPHLQQRPSGFRVKIVGWSVATFEFCPWRASDGFFRIPWHGLRVRRAKLPQRLACDCYIFRASTDACDLQTSMSAILNNAWNKFWVLGPSLILFQWKSQQVWAACWGFTKCLIRFANGSMHEELIFAIEPRRLCGGGMGGGFNLRLFEGLAGSSQLDQAGNHKTT